MANTFFVDYEGGNDSNNGLSFANRKKRIQGISAAELNPGDEIRLMASPRQYRMNVSSNWTFRSPNVTLNAAVTALVDDGDVQWTATTDITTTRNTTVYRTSANAAQIAFGSPFTIGLAAYNALGSAQDYSSYQGLTFWFRTNTVIPSNTLSVCLCSDTAGATVVDTFPIPGINAPNCWVPIYVNKGSALGSSIQSIALYADADPGTPTVLLDNINTVLPETSNDTINLTSVIGRNLTTETANNEGWWAIRGLSGNTITFDMGSEMTAVNVHKGYAGNTATNVAIYKSDVTQLIGNLKANNYSGSYDFLMDAGNTTHYITVSGGWNRTDMTTQTGDTWFDAMTGYGTVFYTNGQPYYNIDRLNCVRGGTAIYIDNISRLGNVYASAAGIGVDVRSSAMNANAIVVTSCAHDAFIGTGLRLYIATSLPPRSTVKKLICYSCGALGTNYNYGITLSTAGSSYNMVMDEIISILNWDGLRIEGAIEYSWIKAITTKWNTRAGVVFSPTQGYQVDTTQIDYIDSQYNAAEQIYIDRYAFGTDVVLGNFIGKNGLAGTSTGLAILAPHLGTVKINSIDVANNTTNLSLTPTIYGGKMYILKSNGIATLSVVSSNALHGEHIFRNYNGVAGDHRSYVGGTAGTIFSNTSVRHTASGLSWRFSPLSSSYIDFHIPLKKKIAAVAVSANTLVTMTLWVYRDNTGLNSYLVVPGGQIGGVSADVIATASGAINTWEQLTLTFTPTETGVVEAYFKCWGGSTYNVVIDDFNVTQA